MKQFLIKIAIFLLLILSLATITDIFVSKGLQHCPKNHLETMNIVMQEKPANDVLILGNSRGSCGYDTHIIDSILGCNCLNISVSGKSFRVVHLEYEAYRRNNPAPRLIIFDIDHHIMGKGVNGFENEMFYPYINDTLVQPELEMNNFSWLDIYCPMYRYRGNHKYISLGLCEFFNLYHIKGKSYKGYCPNPNNSWNGDIMREEIKKHPNGLGIGFDTTVLKIAESFISKAKAEGIQMVMIYSPLHYQIQNHLSPDYNKLTEIYKSFSQTYDVPILNYQHIPLNQDSTFFKDGNHLNQLGAEVFTTLLANDIDSLGLYK